MLLHVCTNTTTDCFQIELSSKNSECCIFKIFPRYKVRSVGDKVCYNDQVKFESLKTKGQFLHCSNHRYRDNFYVLKQWFVFLFSSELLPLALINSYELNLSGIESALMIIPHYCPLPSHDPKALRVCEA